MHHVVSVDQLFPHPAKVCTSGVPFTLLIYLGSFDHRLGLCPDTFSSKRLRGRHLSHDALSAFAFSLCSQSCCPSFDGSREREGRTPTPLAQNLRRRSDAVLDQPLIDKIHSPSTHPFGLVVLWAPVIGSFENAHSSQTYFSVIQRRTLELLVALGVTSDLFPASLPFRYHRVSLARHTVVTRI